MSLKQALKQFLATAIFSVSLGLSTTRGHGQPSTSSPARTEVSNIDSEAQELLRDILTQTPDKPLIMLGALRHRDGDGKRTEIPLRYSIIPEAGGWRGIYETRPTASRGAERLEIIRRDHQPLEYLHAAAGGPGAAPQAAVSLRGSSASVPFAASDYWLSDLGLEFLHWPNQRLVREAKIKMRQGRPCKVIESLSPDSSATKYARVLSWLDSETGAPIYAEGFDDKGARIKTFSLHGFAKINGRWQPKELEMLDERTDSKTRLELSIMPE